MEPGVASVQAVELNPEIRIVVVDEDNLPARGKRKPTLCMWRKAAILSYDRASEGGYHRGLRAGHVLTGVARELGRAHDFPAILCRSEGYRLTKGSWRSPCVSPREASPKRGYKFKGKQQGAGSERRAKRPG
jgi:hypothetical protein